MIECYLGFDPREEVGYHTFCSSVIHRASVPVRFTPLDLGMLGRVYGAGQRDGTNTFIYTRFLIPYLQCWTGWALFVDGADMIVQEDISELWNLRDHYKAVQVVKHDYQTKHLRKYVGTDLEAENRDYPRKNWSSVMLINCSHFAWRDITPDRVEKMSGADLHQFRFIPDRYVGELPKEWNWLADEYGDNPAAKLLHWTAGVPAFENYKQAPMADKWHEARELV